jgi:hypothetical protein
MADRLPFGGGSSATPNKPRRMLYQQDSWTLPSCGSNITDLEYDLRVGKITQEEYDAKLAQAEVAALAPAKRTAVRKHPRTR